MFAVGDEDQSIYGFRGARPDFLLEFEQYFNNTKNKKKNSIRSSRM
ncbi:UvrD-helicase domain-containing protein [Clostridioides difficile]